MSLRRPILSSGAGRLGLDGRSATSERLGRFALTRREMSAFATQKPTES